MRTNVRYTYILISFCSHTRSHTAVQPTMPTSSVFSAHFSTVDASPPSSASSAQSRVEQRSVSERSVNDELCVKTQCAHTLTNQRGADDIDSWFMFTQWAQRFLESQTDSETATDVVTEISDRVTSHQEGSRCVTALAELLSSDATVRGRLQSRELSPAQVLAMAGLEHHAKREHYQRRRVRCVRCS